MFKPGNIKWIPILMAVTILAIISFQLYWLQKAYDREKRTLEMRTNILFKETVRSLQASKLKLDSMFGDSTRAKRIMIHDRLSEKYIGTGSHIQKMGAMMDVLIENIKDTNKTVIISEKKIDTNYFIKKSFPGRKNRLIQFLYDVDSLQDSIKVKELQAAYSKKLEEQNINVPFKITRVATRESEAPVFNEITLGFASPITYKLLLGNSFPYLLKRILAPLLFSFFLVAFTLLSFLLLYRNMLRQNRLANIKNEFISNITHELKTPIATVSVAIEALRTFSNTLDPVKTKEYLDISANELQRLSLLVDKVLKLSMFEKKEVELKYEKLDMKELVEEVTSSMRLQFEKHHALIKLKTEGDTTLEGDRLHLVSVLFNLFDNALKYSRDHPEIDILIKGDSHTINLIIKDSGIGIPAEYQNKIFEKFFRVPTGNLHNAKGYGLGLSYVAHVIARHKGSIKVKSVEGDGASFMITLPKLCA